MKTFFLICALALPSPQFTWPRVVSYHEAPAVVPYQMERSEEDRLRDNLKKHPDILDVFITPEGTEDVLHDHGWSKAPFSINGKQVWIQRKPKSDIRMKIIEEAA